MSSRKKQLPKSIYLSEQGQSELKSLLTWLEARISDIEEDEDFGAENEITSNLLPSLRGLVSYILEEYYEDDFTGDYSPHLSADDDDDDDDDSEEEFFSPEEEDEDL